MKKFFFLALMAFLWLPATMWADNEVGEEGTDNEQEDYDDGRIEATSVPLVYKILTAATDQTEAGAGTVELEGVSSTYSGTVGALSIPHVIHSLVLEGTEASVYYYTVTGIAQNAFTSNTSLTSITIPYTVTYIGIDNTFQNGAFNGCTNLTSVTFAENASNQSQLTFMGYQTFYGCTGLTSIELPTSLTTLGDCVFQGCSALASIELPESLTNLGGSFLRGCSSLTEVKIPENITMITANCFNGCSSLTTVWMSGSAQIYSNAFADCTSLRSFVLEGSEPATTGGAETSGSDWFSGDGDDVITLYVPTGSAPAYLQTAWETDRTNRTEVETLQWNFLSTDISSSGWDGEETYYATFYTDAIGEFGDDVTPNIVTSAGESGEVEYSALTDYIPAGTGLLLTSDAAATTYYYHPYETTIGEVTTADVSGNMLYGSITDATTDQPAETGYYFYKLSRNSDGDDGSVGFYWANETGGAFTCLAYKAYLAVPIDDATPTSYSFKKGEEDTTGISAVESASEKAISGIYTIQGVRVSNMNQPGLYIVDGKKVLVK